MKYSLSDIAAICGGTFRGYDTVIDRVTTDSRSFLGYDSRPLFVAISGCNHDGHTYINELYAKGVRGFVVEKDINTDKYPDAGFVIADCSVGALQALAADYRTKFRGTVVGITGSNGKTIIKEWVSSLAPQGVRLFRSPKSYNSQIGVPLSVLMIRGDEDVAVIEAGISQPGEMERLESIIRPDIVAITTIGNAHQEYFDSTQHKIAEKLVLARHAKNIIYNSSYEELAAQINKVYGDRELYDARHQKAAYDFFKDNASKENAAMAIAIWDALGYDHAATISHLCDLCAIAMRLELKEGINNSIIINDSYNSDINSLAIALDYMKSVAGDRPTMLILSDILQSGLPHSELYARVAQMVEAAGIKSFVGIGPDITPHRGTFGGDAAFYATTEDFLSHISSEKVSGRAILIKGNRASGFGAISHALELRSHTTTLEIDLDAMIYNLEALRSLLRPGVKVMAMVKAAGYGHGNYEIANMLQGKGVDYLAVAYADEGVVLRKAGITMPVVVLNADSDSFDLMVAHNLEPEIYSMSSLKSFATTVRRHGERSYPVHIKADTGMHRLGFELRQAEELGRELLRYAETLRVASIFSHLAAADEPCEDKFTHAQIINFERFCADLSKIINYRPLRHIANSAATERIPHAQFEMVRLGIGLYGVGEINGIPLRKVSTLRTRIVQVKTIASGDTVGYGREGKVGIETRVATIPVGYADGINRKLGSGNWAMSVRRSAARTVGRICMDTCMIDITGIDAQEGDEVIVFGPHDGYTVEDMAHVLDTIPYEVMTSVSGRVKRIYSKE